MKDTSREIEMLLFDAALQIDDNRTRRAFLDQTCKGLPEMRERLEELLEAHRLSEAYFSGVTQVCAVDAEPFCPPPDVVESIDKIGPYRLLERIGEGGCGVVFLAEQQEPVRRRVALKVIRLGMDTEHVIARFEMERQALAMMDHPHIAHVLEAGTTPTGRPYFAMEWVRGRKINDFCDENRLTIRQRIELFIEVCQAIQHAHQKGIIHRDIKPSNVLVLMQDGKPLPKIIDFGIAKATDGSGCCSDFTEAGGMPMGTLASMSPEQAASGGIDVDTRSDLYSLGVLLYELLSSRPVFEPAELSAVGFSASLEILLYRQVPPPSTIIAALPPANAIALAACRDTEVPKWISTIKDDLDHVVMKCLEKDRCRRYETVNGLALDLSRFLANEPVQARPPSQFYRFQKFVNRNKVACISTLLVTIAALACFTISTALYLRANTALKEQLRLRQVAETSQTAEAVMRQQTQARANVSRAALLLNQGKTSEADQVLRQTPLNTIEPSQEATGVFRALGDWHLIHHRWKAATECYLLLPLANRFIPGEQIPDTGDMIRTAPVLVMAGMHDAYESHRNLLIERFTNTTNSNTAEQLVKMCLIEPASPELIQRLHPTVDFLKKQSTAVIPRLALFVHMSIALFELRAANPAEAIRWVELAQPLVDEDPAAQNDNYQTFLSAILVMACRQSNDTTRAETEAVFLKDFLQKHGGTFDRCADPENQNFVPIIDRMLAIILAREALRIE